jgi:hypothetical protein
MPGRALVEIIQAPPASVVASGFFLAADRYEDLVDPMFEAVGIMAEQIKENFDTESSGGDAWEEWSIFYRKTRELGGLREEIFEKKLASGQVGFGKRTVMVEADKILQLTGDLYSGATNAASWDVSQEGHDVVAILEAPEYGVFHVMGSPQTYLPIRDWSFIPDDAIDDIEEKFLEYVDADL